MSIYEYFSVHECITKGFIVTGGMNVYLLSNKKKNRLTKWIQYYIYI